MTHKERATVVSEGVLIQETLGKVPSWREIEVWRLAWDECRKQTLAEAERLCRAMQSVASADPEDCADAIAKLAEGVLSPTSEAGSKVGA